MQVTFGHSKKAVVAYVQVLAAKGPKMILELPGACFLPEHEPHVSTIFRHILEDPVTLQAAMEAQIRNILSAGARPSEGNCFAIIFPS